MKWVIYIYYTFITVLDLLSELYTDLSIGRYPTVQYPIEEEI